MKIIIMTCLLMMAANSSLIAQSPSVNLANKIADKMKDTLGLTTGQRTQVFAINVRLNNDKAEAWTQITNSDSLRIKLQRVENIRDSLYKPVLTIQQYDLYREKKRNLVNNN